MRAAPLTGDNPRDQSKVLSPALPKAPSTTDRLLAAVLRHGREAVSFQSLEPGIEVWTDPESGGVVPYAGTSAGWVAVGTPLVAEASIADVARRFSDAAHAAGRRVAWFGAEDRIPGFAAQAALMVGEQPSWDPRRWPEVVTRSRSLREQLRRARAAGVVVRRSSASELRNGCPLRERADALAGDWLGRRRMEPMGFLVTVAPWCHPDAHRYFIAERNGRLVAFLSLVPIPSRAGFLFEDLLRAADAPNGTSELLIDAAMRAIAGEGAELASLGLAPLSGDVGLALRLARVLGRGLYDFRGLRAFKERLRPHAWTKVWLLVPDRGPLASSLGVGLGLLDVLRAFANNRLASFIFRTILRHPSATCIALALPLAPWTAFLLVLSVLGAHGPLGFSRGALAAWAMFDAALDFALWSTALRPRANRLAALAVLASLDAVASILRVCQIGMGGSARHGLLRLLLRFLATAAPVAGAVALWGAAARGLRRRARSPAVQNESAAARRKKKPPMVSEPNRRGSSLRATADVVPEDRTTSRAGE